MLSEWQGLLLVTLVVIPNIVLAVWNLYLFARRREFDPKIEFLVDILFKVDLGDHWIAEVVSTVRNRGVAGHEATELTFRLHGLKSTDQIKLGGDEINNQLHFPHLIKSGRWFRRERQNTFVEAGTTQFYRHTLVVPKSYIAVIIHGSTQYTKLRPKNTVIHTANRLVRVPQTWTEAEAYSSGEYSRIVLSNDDVDRISFENE